MSYELRAAIGDEPALRALAVGSAPVPLADGLLLVPIPVRSGRPVGRFHGLTEPLREELVAASHAGRVAFVEAEFFGGRGTQSAIAWHGGSVVLGPLHTQTHEGGADDYTTTADLAINQVLRSLGVTASDGGDAFATVDLGRHRETEGWLARPDRPDS